MDRDTLLVIITVLITIAFEVYTAITGNNPNRVLLSLPLASIAIAFLLFLYLISKAEKRLSQSLDRRLPEIVYMDARKEVETEMLKLAEQADDFIVATGGRSRNVDYLDAIERKVQSIDITYWRLIFNEQITHEICDHLCSIVSLSNVVVGQIEDRTYSNLLVVDTGFIIALPTPGHGGLMGIKIPNNLSSRRMFRYLMMINLDAKRLSNPQQIKALCEQCSKEATTTHTPDAFVAPDPHKPT